MKRWLLILVGSGLIFSWSAVAAVNPVFNRDLFVGSVGEDVRTLQQWLNRSGYVVATSCLGAPGQETTYFGALTSKALARYQAAAGIVPAGGALNQATRLKIAGQAQVAVANLPSGCTSTIGFSPLTGTKCDTGQTGAVNQTNLPPGCSSAVGDSPLTGVKCDSLAKTIVVGSTFNQAVTKTPITPAVLASQHGSAAAGGPKITSISPTSGPNGTTITITGTGFSLTNNLVKVPYGNLKNIPSKDGKTMQITFNSPMPAKAQKHLLPLPMFIGVSVNGVVSNFMPFTFNK